MRLSDKALRRSLRQAEMGLTVNAVDAVTLIREVLALRAVVVAEEAVWDADLAHGLARAEAEARHARAALDALGPIGEDER